MTRLADLATRRPLALLAPAVVAAGALVALAFGAPRELSAAPEGPSGLTPGARSADLAIVASGPFPVRSGVYRVAVDVLLAGLRSDPGVASARLLETRGQLAVLAVFLAASDETSRERAAARLQAGIDPGPLHLDYGGPTIVLANARHSLAGQLWKLELLALPFVALVLAWFLGAAAGLGAAIAAAGAVGMTLVGLRVGAAFADVSALGLAPGAVLGLVLPVELAAMLRSLHREERLVSTPADALAHALRKCARLGVPLVALACLAPLALLIAPFPAIGWLVLGTILAGIGALAFTAAAVPPLLALEARVTTAGAVARRDGRLGEASRRLLGRVASSWVLLAATIVVALAAPLALAAPARDAETRAFSVVDLPPRSQAAVTAREATGIETPKATAAASFTPDRASSLASTDGMRRLPLAAAMVAGALAIALLIIARSPRPLAAIPFAVLPAAAALGVIAFVIAQGHLAGSLGLREEGSLDTGAVGCGLAAVVGVSAGRCARDWLAVKAEGELGAGAGGTAELGAGLVLLPALAASLVGAAACGVLAGADLYAAREFGLLVAVGLLIDLLLRPPLLALLSRLAPGK